MTANKYLERAAKHQAHGKFDEARGDAIFAHGELLREGRKEEADRLWANLMTLYSSL